MAIEVPVPPVRSKIVPLSHPVANDDGEIVSELTVREPTGKDIRLCGYPLNVMDGSGSFVEAKMSKMIAALAGIYPMTVDSLPLADWTNLAVAIASFLEPAAPTSSTATTNAPGSGATTPLT